MYDTESEALIQRAPNLSELDLEKLPDELSKAYAEIVAFRTRIRESIDSEESLDIDTDRLVRLASTYEAYVSLLRESNKRDSAAFVSGTAYQLLWLLESSLSNQINVTRLQNDSVSTDISALLLFLIAGYTGDAAEVADRLDRSASSIVRAELIKAISLLARGQLSEIAELKSPAVETQLDDPFLLSNLGAEALYAEILSGVVQLARELLGLPTESSAQTFRTVMNLAVETVPLDSSENVDLSLLDTFSGPHHLATLMLEVGETLRSSSVLRIPPPKGVDEILWNSFLAELVARRPFLWRNHRSAIEAGYLDPGTSSAVSFPTGAGKSTVSELKIASTLFAGGKVLFLVPTHALVSQVSRDMKKTFPKFDVRGTLLIDGEYAETEGSELPDIAVVTPERCLTQLGVSPEAFSELRLIVFDECHLLHPSNGTDDKRSLDAMLCVLGLFENAPHADFALLSAMMKNAHEISEWISSATGRNCLALDLDWKPTRQARGCLVYDLDDLQRLQGGVNERRDAARNSAKEKFREWSSSGKKGKQPVLSPKPKAADRKGLTIDPRVLFCLKQQWAGNSFDDYVLVPILDTPLELALSDGWYLTANRNSVAKEIANNFARSKIKTLVFAQNRKWAYSISEGLAASLGASSEFHFSKEEERWLEIAAHEAGGAAHVYKPINGVAACHHGLLLPSERNLNESAFTRRDGLLVLAATPTLAQGINLPAEVVLMAGDDRFDQNTGANSQLRAHELLNAAGRAGRAGYVSNGIVLVIPGSNVGLNLEEVTLSRRWFELKESFANPDKCLEIEDPIDVFLDLIQSEIPDESKKRVEYFLTRLPVGADDKQATQMLGKTLGGYRARTNDKLKEFQVKVANAIDIRNQVLDRQDELSWQTELSSKTGLPALFIDELSDAMQDLGDFDKSVVEWVTWFFEWLSISDQRIYAILSEITVDALTKAGGRSKNRRSVAEAMDLFFQVTKMWVNGATLAELEVALGTDPGKIKFCDTARMFVSRWLRELSYGIGLVALIPRKRTPNEHVLIQRELAVAASCVKEGYGSCELLALSHVVGEPHARTEISTIYEALKPSIEQGEDYETFGRTKSRMRFAYQNM